MIEDIITEQLQAHLEMLKRHQGRDTVDLEHTEELYRDLLQKLSARKTKINEITAYLEGNSHE